MLKCHDGVFGKSSSLLGIGKLRQTHVKDIDLCPFAYALYRQGKLGHLHILFK